MTAQRSTFVTVVAWVFIIGSGFATLISLMQNLMFRMMAGHEGFTEFAEQAPEGMGIMFGNFQLVLVFFLLMALAMLASSIGLLKRHNWARWVFIVMLGFGVIWCLLGLLMQWWYFSMMASNPEIQGFEEFQSMHDMMLWFSVGITAGIGLLFGWIIKRLLSAPVKQEFTSPG